MRLLRRGHPPAFPPRRLASQRGAQSSQGISGPGRPTFPLEVHLLS